MTRRSALQRFGADLALVGVVLLATAAPTVFHWVRGAQTGPDRPHVVIEMTSDTASIAQLFYDTGAGFSEEQADSVFVTTGATNRLVFKIGAPAVKAFRFDPLTTGGTVRILHAWGEDAGGTRAVPIDPHLFEPANQIASTSNDAAGRVVVIAAGATDPQLLATLPRPLVFPHAAPPWPWLVLGALGVGLIGVGWPAVRHRTLWTGAAAACVAVVTLGIAFLWPLHRTLDLPIWDEANYFGWRRIFAATGSLGEFAGSPVYHLWYALWDKVASGGAAIFVSQYALKSLLLVLSLLVACRWFKSWIAAGFVTAAVALSMWQLTFPLLVYHAAFVSFLAALAVADRSRVAAVGFLAIAALTRLEYTFVALATLALWSIAAWKSRSTPTTAVPQTRPPIVRLLGFIPLVVAIYVAWHVQGSGFGGRRAWFAFQQHYAVGMAESGRAPGINPWIDYHLVTDHDFPAAQSLGDALRINGSAVLQHVGRNLQAAPRELARFFATTHDGARGAWAGIALLVSAGLATIWFPSRNDSERDQTSRWSSLAAWAGLAALPPGLIVYAKTAYLLPAIPLGWWLLARASAWLRARLAPDSSTPRTAFAAVVFIVVGAVIAESAPRPLSVPQPQPVKANVAILRREFPQPIRLLGLSAESYVAYLEPGSVGIEPFASERGEHGDAHEASLAELIERTHPDAILVTAMWQGTAMFDRAAVDALPAQAWKKVALADGTLFVRELRR